MQKALADLDRAVAIITGPAYLNEETHKFARMMQTKPQSEEEAFRLIKEIFGIDFAALGDAEKAAWGQRYEQAVKVLNNVAQVYWKRSQVRYEAGDATGAENDRLAACNACEAPELGIVDKSSNIVIDSDFCKPARAFHPFPSRKALAAFQNLKLGQRAYGKMRREIAINHLSRAIALDSRLVEAYIVRAHVYMYVDPSDCDRAIADFSSALDIEPNNAQALYERGLTYFKLGKDRNWERDPDGARRHWAAAEADFTRVLTLDENHWKNDARIQRAKVYESLGRFASAADDYAAAIEATGIYEHFLDKAQVLKLAGDHAAAIRAIDEYLAAARAALTQYGEAGDSYLSDKIAEAEAMKKELAGPN